MDEKNLRRILWLGILIIAAIIIYAFWANCIVPLRDMSHGDIDKPRASVDGKKSNSNLNPRSIYIYFPDWAVQTLPDETIRIDELIAANKPFKMFMSLRQVGIGKVGVSYVSVVFSTNTVIYSDTAKDTRWVDSGRADAKEFRYDIYANMPPNTKLDMPKLDIMFKTAGLYEMKYTIMLESFEKVEGSCAFKVLESE